MIVKKNINIEMLRILSMAGVILIHMSMGYFDNKNIIGSFDWKFASLVTSFSKFSVPVFFIISSYIFFQRNNISLLTILKSFKRIAPPFLFWAIIYWFFPANLFEKNGIKDFVIKLSTGVPVFHFWFFYTFVIFIAALPLILFIRNILNSYAYLAISLSLISLVCMTPLLFEGNEKYEAYTRNPFRPDLLIYALLIPFILKAPKSKPLLYLLGFIAICFICFLLTVNQSITSGQVVYSFIELSSATMVLASFFAFLFIMSLNFNSSGLSSRMICLLGESTFGVYLIHWLVYLYLDKYGMMIHESAFKSIVVDSIVLLATSYVLVIILRRLPIVRNVL